MRGVAGRGEAKRVVCSEDPPPIVRTRGHVPRTTPKCQAEDSVTGLLLCLSQCLPERGFWTMIPWDAVQIQDSVGQLTLGIITKLCLFLGDSGLTVTSRVNQTGRAEWHL